MTRRQEMPPTASLPPFWADLLPGKADLASELERLFSITHPQIECSGTAALVVSLSLLKQQSNRTDVIIPGYTCPLIALAIVHCGLKIKLCDLAPNSFDFDFNHLDSLANENTLAIIPTHLGGRVANVQKAKDIADRYGAFIIEDAAQALGANVGYLGDITFYSMAAGKGVSIYEGGILTAKDEKTRSKLREMSSKIILSDWRWELKRCCELIGYTAFYRPGMLYYAYGLPRRRSLDAGRLPEAVGDVFDKKIPLHKVSHWRKNAGAKALQRFPAFLEQTRLQAIRRCIRLQQIKNIFVFEDEKDVKGTWPFLMVLMPNRESRNQVMSHLWKSTLGVSRLFIHALPDYDYLQSVVPQPDLPYSRDFADRLLTITNSLWLDDSRFDNICRVIESAVEHH